MTEIVKEVDIFFQTFESKKKSLENDINHIYKSFITYYREHKHNSTKPSLQLFNSNL